MRPFAFYGYGELGVHTKGTRSTVVIMSWPWGNVPRRRERTHGIAPRSPPGKRDRPNTIPHAAKATGHLPQSDARRARGAARGYDEAILLTDEG
jgi:branched-chain amino acid aminotransferase